MSSRDEEKIADERPASFEGESRLRYKFSQKFTKNKKILDIGCGLGFGANFLANHGSRLVVGVDDSKKAIEYAQKHFHKKNLKLIYQDGLKISDLKIHFDTIIGLEVIEHLPKGSYSSFVRRISRALNAHGICIISTPNKLVSSPDLDKPSNPFHTKEFTPAELVRLCAPHFKEIKLFGLKCVNKRFLQQRVLIEKTFRKKVITYICGFKITHLLLPFIPSLLKTKVTKRNLLPDLKESDFIITPNNFDSSDGLIIVCKK